MNKLITVLFALVVSIDQASAAFPKKVQIIGTIKSITENIVVIETRTGSIKVPKKTLQSQSNLKKGERAVSKVSLSQLKELNS